MAAELVETEHDRDRVADYLGSGDDMWSRNPDLLDGVQKVETEALNPVELRDLAVGVIGDTTKRPLLMPHFARSRQTTAHIGVANARRLASRNSIRLLHAGSDRRRRERRGQSSRRLVA
jgi:hypothetical protein